MFVPEPFVHEGIRYVYGGVHVLDVVDSVVGALRRPGRPARSHVALNVESAQKGLEAGHRGVATVPAEPDDTIFPCMAITDMEAAVGDSGGAVIADRAPAGVTAREFGGRLGFTPLAEGLEDLGLTLCTDPDCGLRRP